MIKKIMKKIKKSGFTLVELLGVIAVVAIIAGIAVVSISGILGGSKKSVYTSYEKTVMSSTENYFLDHIDEIPSIGGNKKLYLNELLSLNYIKRFENSNNKCDYEESYVAVTRNRDKSNNFSLNYYVCLVMKNDKGEVIYQGPHCDTDLEVDLTTDAKCFNYSTDSGEIRLNSYDKSCGDTVVFPSSLPVSKYSLNTSLTSSELAKCIEKLSSYSWEWHEGDTPEKLCNGEKDYNEDDLNMIFNFLSKEDQEYFITNNIFKKDQDENYPITYIPEGFFEGAGLKEIVIPDTVIRIESGAFANNQLTRLELPDSVTYIGDHAFRDNPSLTYVSFGKSNITFGGSVFLRSPVQTIKMNMPSTPSGEYTRSFLARQQLTVLKEVIIGDNVKEISNYTFGSYNDTGTIERVTIGNSVERIGEATFARNNITEVNLPDSLKYIATKAFIYNQITNLSMGNGVENIQTGAFLANHIKNLVIPNSTQYIYSNAFEFNDLEEVSVGNGVEFISYGAFAKNSNTASSDSNIYTNNVNLSKVTINKSCTDLKKLTYYPFLAENSPYTATNVSIYGANNELCNQY